MTSFTDITESVKHIRNNNKKSYNWKNIQPAEEKRPLKRLSALDLVEGINTLVSSGTLYKNDKNSLFIGTLANTSKKNHKRNELSNNFTDAESNGNFNTSWETPKW